MSFAAKEISREDGQPIEFYKFVLGSTAFRYTTAEDEITLGADIYVPTGISRERILMGSEQKQDVITVTMPTNKQPATQFISVVPGQPVFLTILRQHSTDGATPQVVTIFKGKVRAIAYSQDGFEAKLSVMSLSNSMGVEFPRFTYQGLCNHFLYDERCQVAQASFETIGTVSVESGSVLTVPGLSAKADGFFTSGFIQSSTPDFRLVLSHTGDNITILLPFQNPVLGSIVSVFAGCDHTIATCKSKFNIVENYGGFAFVPKKNPFQTGLD